jgi:hypothetical protein
VLEHPLTTWHNWCDPFSGAKIQIPEPTAWGNRSWSGLELNTTVPAETTHQLMMSGPNQLMLYLLGRTFYDLNMTISIIFLNGFRFHGFLLFFMSFRFHGFLQFFIFCCLFIFYLFSVSFLSTFWTFSTLNNFEI